MNHRTFFRAICVAALAGVSFQPAAFAALNSWVLPASGDWHVPSNWSLGVLPDSAQSVLIDAPGWKAVNISPATSANYPSSLTVRDITISNNTTQDLNTLLLNYAGTDTPLRVMNGVVVKDAARIVNFNSGLVVDGGDFAVTNAEIIQDGGFVRATNGNVYLDNSTYYMTNGDYDAGALFIGPRVRGTFYQYGGSAALRRLNFFNGASGGGGGTYNLAGGQLNMQRLEVVSENNGVALFSHTGGTNRSQELVVASGLFGTLVQYTLAKGYLETSNTVVLGGGSSSTFQQDGGIHNCTHELSMEGDLRHFIARGASYILNGGQLSAPSVSVKTYAGFTQSNGLAFISGNFLLSASSSAFYRWSSSLHGGTLACSNFQSAGIGANFFQTGGALIVTNSLGFGGTVPFSGPSAGLPTFTFSGGTIVASNIGIGGEFIIGSSALAGRLTNPGSFSLGGTLRVGDASEQLGRFTLASASTLDLGFGSARLRFASSATESWSSDAFLSVTNWAGSTNGGGSDQLKFGSNASGLTPVQLRQLVFSNPSGFAPANYPAQILSTGEVVPAPRSSLSATHSRTNLVLTWPGGWVLQSSTNVAGPYLDLSGSTSPFTNQFSAGPQRFFRLRQ